MGDPLRSSKRMKDLDSFLASKYYLTVLQGDEFEFCPAAAALRLGDGLGGAYSNVPWYRAVADPC